MNKPGFLILTFSLLQPRLQEYRPCEKPCKVKQPAISSSTEPGLLVVESNQEDQVCFSQEISASCSSAPPCPSCLWKYLPKGFARYSPKELRLGLPVCFLKSSFLCFLEDACHVCLLPVTIICQDQRTQFYSDNWTCHMQSSEFFCLFKQPLINLHVSWLTFPQTVPPGAGAGRPGSGPCQDRFKLRKRRVCVCCLYMGCPTSSPAHTYISLNLLDACNFAWVPSNFYLSIDSC